MQLQVDSGKARGPSPHHPRSFFAWVYKERRHIQDAYCDDDCYGVITVL
jgi:hypothetical protein